MTPIANELATRMTATLESVVVGSERTAFGLLVALYSRGHVLVEGVPGTGKTLAVRVLAMALGATYRRIQFTPDLMPADVIGTTIFNPQSAQFSTRPGPIVANIVLADEINRTPPKTQAALLEAMEEGRVTIDGSPIPLPDPFLVAATQNPVEYEGTYPLPEAQLDRFLVKIDATYPRREDELRLLERVAGGFDARKLDERAIAAVTSPAEVLQAQEETRAVHVVEPVQRYIYDIIAATRSHANVALGASPRAGVALLIAAQAAAAIAGRTYATPDDVKDVSSFVLPHRLIVQPQAEIEGVRSGGIVREILDAVPVPRETAA